MKKKVVLMTSALMAVGLLAGCGKSDHTHEWGDVVYEWSADHKSCTATRVCKDDESHKETETKNSAYAVTKEAKCEEDGSGRYTVTFDNEAFGTTHFDIALESTGHDWGTPTYTWSDDYSSCTATRVCKNDSNHIESETADSAYTVIVPATCDTDGSAVYDAAFENEAFEVQSHEITLPATEHNWGEPTYVWSDDNLKCTATRVCANDSTDVEEEVATATISNITATCTEDGTSTYTATFKKEGFATQVKENVPYKALGHDYQFVEFVWEGFFAAKAKFVCSHDESHVELHDAQVADSLVNPATCEEEGLRTWTATYEDHSETKKQTIEALGHSLVHVSEKAATCTEDGVIEHWHCSVCEKNYEDELGTKPLNNLVTEKLGHDWNEPTYEWNADHTECTASRTCKRDANHVESETKQSTYEVITPNTCTEGGEGKYTVEFENPAFAKQTYNRVLNPKGHNWGTPVYEWNDDKSKCTATIVCGNDEKHVVTETVNSYFGVGVEPSGNNTGSLGICAEFESELFDKQVISHYGIKINSAGTAYSIASVTSEISGSVVIPSMIGELPVTSIEDEAFYRNAAITSVTIPNTIVSIKSSAFEYCTGLTTVSFEADSHLTTIGQWAFDMCTALTSIFIPKSVTTISRSAFTCCYKVSSIVFEEGINLTAIDRSAFQSCSEVTSITLPEGLKTIGEFAFATINGLKEINIPKSITSIRSNVFYYSSNFKTINFAGTIEEWNNVSKSDGWYSYTGLSVIHCSDGDINL
ncbi:MAG: leucine-rich repeat domain-containing protein [Bacilli bacterium]|nr:leucine-rich repeat domain-containing protein [Bacilli bacterium]